MLSGEQVHLVPGCHERQRTSAPAEDGIGLQGVLSSQFDSEFGTIDSLSRSRIITGPEETLIAQPTLTALHDSPVNWANIQRWCPILRRWMSQTAQASEQPRTPTRREAPPDCTLLSPTSPLRDRATRR